MRLSIGRRWFAVIYRDRGTWRAVSAARDLHVAGTCARMMSTTVDIIPGLGQGRGTQPMRNRKRKIEKRSEKGGDVRGIGASQ